MIDAHDLQLAPLDQQLRAYARRQAGCRALMGHYGIEPLTSIAILAELGDTRRFSSSREAVRYAVDITVHQSDARRAPGHLSRQGPPALHLRLGALRGRPMHAPTRLTRPRLLPAGSRTARRQPRLPGRRTQAAQPQLPRGRARSPHSRRCTAAGSACSCCYHPVDGLHRPSGRTASRNTPNPSCRRPRATPDRGPR